MPIATGDVFGSDQLGVYLACVGNVVFHPRELEAKVVEEIQTALEAEMVGISIGGSQLIGSLLAGNSKGMAVADLATQEDLDVLTSFGDVVVLESGINTAGNLLLVNEKGAVASPAIPDFGLEILADVLQTDVTSTTIADHDVVGSLGIANDHGVLLHPDVGQTEVELIQDVLGVKPMVGTVSFGSPFVGAGLVASNSGAYVGSDTTGPELNRIEDALGLI
ncbi:MAG TPA: translation initiation factor IF-6 [Candidatus Poseidoniales archaeon]|nr:translation initiation factor IF-6 [Candidatus Poseidoniales archaeon]HIO94086.1 translation initiation factor IF-6 [Candidatus Poseidoniales archaeon]